MISANKLAIDFADVEVTLSQEVNLFGLLEREIFIALVDRFCKWNNKLINKKLTRRYSLSDKRNIMRDLMSLNVNPLSVYTIDLCILLLWRFII